MKIISISKKRFDKLQELELPREVLNTEAMMYEFNYMGEEKILKYLYILNGSTFANKLYTLEMLDNYKKYLPHNFYIPDYLCSIDGEICAFTIPKIEGINLSTILTSKDMDYKEQLYYLRKVGEILRQLEYIRNNTDLKDIYLNDLHDSNFIVDLYSRELKVIDLDSCKIGTNDPSSARFLTPFALLNYVNKYNVTDDENAPAYVIADENSDLYCYSIMILNYIFGKKINSISIDDFYRHLNYLDTIGVSKKLTRILSKIVADCDNENPMDYIETLTERQLIKTRMFK